MVQLHLIRFHLQNQVLTLIQLQKIKLTLTQILIFEPLTITATVTVTEENVALNANVSYAYDSDTDNNQAFTNYYVAPKQLDFDVHFTKSLVGRPLNNEEFQFTMKNLDGEVIATGTNNATGQINFNFIEGKRPTYTNADLW